jgi:PAS domain S-box-containing protein
MAFRDLTIKRKLTVLMMGVSAAAALIACIVFNVMTTGHLKKSYHDDLSSLAQVLARNCEASLAFQLPEEAARVVSTLSARPSVIYALIRDAQGAAFAQYGEHPDRSAGAPGLSNPPDRAARGYLAASQDIVLGGNVIGSLTLYDDMRGIQDAQKLAVSMMFLAVLLSLVAVAALVAPLQKSISGPIIALSSSVERISRERDFSLRAEKAGSDEVGLLVDAFNTMIGRIEKANAELSESEVRFRTLVDRAVDAFYLFDPDGRVVDVNQRACDSLGYTRDEVLALSIRDIECVDDAHVLSSASLWMALETPAAVTTESAHRRKDGAVFPVEMRLGLLEIGGRRRIMGLARDISERRESEAERGKLEAQLRQAQKMEAIGALAGGVAHDFNNILTAIIGYASLMLQKMKPEDAQHHNLEQILTAAERAAVLTRSLLAFSRKQIVELKPVDVNEMIRQVQKMLWRLIGEDINFTVTCDPASLTVEADRGQLEQVLMNLVTNARDAMPRGGTLRITTSSQVIDERNKAMHNIASLGMYAYITVSDSGTGMEKETLEHIFEPFFTTKEVGKGTGLGLSIVYGIIKKHNGFINVYSEPGKGTSFKIYLPLKPSLEREIHAAPALSLPRGTETLLLAEDDAAVRQMAKSTLEEFGYTVLEACDGAQAVEVFQQNRDRIHLVLSDLIMPKMNGWEAYAAIRKIRPDIKVVFSSGYTADIIAQKGSLDAGVSFLSKPMNPSELLRKIRDALDG